MNPMIGDMCIVVGPNSNGVNEHPAVITHVWANTNPHVVNVTCFLDHANPAFYGSVPLYERKDELTYAVGGKAAYMKPNA